MRFIAGVLLVVHAELAVYFEELMSFCLKYLASWFKSHDGLRPRPRSIFPIFHHSNWGEAPTCTVLGVIIGVVAELEAAFKWERRAAELRILAAAHCHRWLPWRCLCPIN